MHMMRTNSQDSSQRPSEEDVASAAADGRAGAVREKGASGNVGGGNGQTEEGENILRDRRILIFD